MFWFLLYDTERLNNWIASSLLLDFGALTSLIHPTPPAHSFRDPRSPDLASPSSESTVHPDAILSVKKRSRRLRLIKSLVAMLHTFGLDASIDHICKDKLGLERSKAFVGVARLVSRILAIIFLELSVYVVPR